MARRQGMLMRRYRHCQFMLWATLNCAPAPQRPVPTSAGLDLEKQSTGAAMVAGAKTVGCRELIGWPSNWVISTRLRLLRPAARSGHPWQAPLEGLPLCTTAPDATLGLSSVPRAT